MIFKNIQFINIIKLNEFEIKLEKYTPVKPQCVTGVTRILIKLFRFINWPNKNINGEIELANLYIQIA